MGLRWQRTILQLRGLTGAEANPTRMNGLSAGKQDSAWAWAAEKRKHSALRSQWTHLTHEYESKVDTHTHTHIQTYICTHTDIQTYICTHTNTHTYTHTHTNRHTHTNTHTHTHTLTHSQTYICTHTHIPKPEYTHKHKTFHCHFQVQKKNIFYFSA